MPPSNLTFKCCVAPFPLLVVVKSQNKFVCEQFSLFCCVAQSSPKINLYVHSSVFFLFQSLR
jgi:hypothetical protein